jgi:P-type Ca2+ transporter type 2C
MAVLFGFIGTFLGASILGIADGIPFLPLQTLYINFTVQVFLAVGLGYGKARDGLMADAPRPPEQRILPRRLMTWVIVSGLVMAALTLFIIWWAGPVFGESTARTMGLVAFSISNIWFALETSDEEHSILGSDVLFANPTLLKTVGVSIVAILLATELGILQRLLGTVSLTIEQWAICLIASLAILVVAEGRKFLGIHTLEPPKQVATAPVPVPAS